MIYPSLTFSTGLSGEHVTDECQWSKAKLTLTGAFSNVVLDIWRIKWLFKFSVSQWAGNLSFNATLRLKVELKPKQTWCSIKARAQSLLWDSEREGKRESEESGRTKASKRGPSLFEASLPLLHCDGRRHRFSSISFPPTTTLQRSHNVVQWEG